ncbi:capsule assembly Wzi family protein [Colwelliaceae bacterium 6441]
MKLLSHALFILFLLSPIKLYAEPWVDTSNIFLRANIQYLADKGIIKAPVTTFPLMWQDIASDINNVSHFQLDESTKESLRYVKHQLKLAKRSQRTIEINTATATKRFTSFGEDYRANNNLKISTTFISNQVAGKISANYSTSASSDEHIQFDGSYAAFFLGNWVVSAGMQDRWWGPSWDTSLSLTNNARPIPALSISRKSAIPLTIPFSDIEIPWTVTSFMGVMDDERVIKDTQLWGFRLNFKPANNWEIGITRLAQWAGENRPSDFDTFLNVLKGLDNCGGNGPSIEECVAGKEPGNQLAGYDIRWSTSLFSHPLAISFTTFAEDGDRKGGLSILGEERYQVSLESQLKLFSLNWKIFLEGTDTVALCKDGHNGDGTSKIGDCYYEHHIYKTGMRYRNRVVGNLYENDATSVVLGLISQSNSNMQFEFKLRWLQLNKDNHDKAPNNKLIGNTLTPIAENMTMLSGKVQHSYRNWRLTLGSDASLSTFDNAIKDNTEINIFAKIEYNL